MTLRTHRPSVAGKLVAWGAAAVLVAACSSSAPAISGASPSPAGTRPLAAPTTAPQTSPSAELTPQSPSETPAEAPAETPETSGPASSSESPAAIGDVAQGLSNLTSYRFRIYLEGVVPGPGQSAAPEETPISSQPITMEATVVLKPERAMNFTVSGLGGGETGSADMSYVVIGDRLWMSVGGQAMELPAGSAEEMMKSFDALAPDKVFSTSFVGYASGLQQVGIETKNGVRAVHYRFDQQALQGLAQLHGATSASDWSADIWIATDGNYLVSAVQKGKVTSAAVASDYLVSIDITNINDPANKVEPPQ
jgi:hypothetical protein